MFLFDRNKFFITQSGKLSINSIDSVADLLLRAGIIINYSLFIIRYIHLPLGVKVSRTEIDCRSEEKVRTVGRNFGVRN